MKMKSEIKNIGIFLSILLFCIITTACEETPQKSSSLMSSSERATEVTTLAVTTTASSIVTTMNDEKLTEKQFVKAICMEIYSDNPYYTEEDAEEDAKWMVDGAEPFSECALGSITSEENAKEKGRAILIKWAGQKFIDDIESDFVIHDGKQIKFEREHPPYSVTYYEKYDAWIIKTDLPSGKTEDGGWIATPGTPSYVILRGSDGKVLAVC